MAIQENSNQKPEVRESALPQGEALQRNIKRRKLVGQIWRRVYLGAVLIAVIALLSLLYNVVNESFGLVAIVNTIDPDTLTDKPFDDLTEAELGVILVEQMDRNTLRTLMANELLGLNNEQFREVARDPLRSVLDGYKYPPEVADEPIAGLDAEIYVAILTANYNDDETRQLVIDEVVQPQVVGTWKLVPTLLRRDELEKEALEQYPTATFEFRSWIDEEFLQGTYNTRPELVGIRTAIIGSMYMILITIVFAFPIGVGAAIYLEEYATDNFINRVIKVNISNLAGVPSIVYGMLGLVIFVRAARDLTSGATVISAGLTLGLLILPVIIINAQEAIRAVPSSLREASYGLGATKWQTVWRQVLPNAVPGIMTGTILAISRAIGETAPLIVLGAATRITKDPTLTSKFTALPIQIFQLTSNPERAFRNAAAAAIIVLLIMLLTMNSAAIILRNRFSRRY